MAAPDLAVVLEADLLVDTAAGGRQPGVRAGARGRGRQLLYSSGELYLDLRLSRSRGAAGCDLIGQVLAGSSAEPMRDLAVELEYGDGSLLSTRSDSLGEFLFACAPDAPGAPARMAVELERQARLEIPLPENLLSGEEEG